MDGRFHNFHPNGTLEELVLNDTIPCIMITQFEPILSKHVADLSQAASSTCLIEAVLPLLPAQQNRFLLIRIDAMYSWIKFRGMPARTIPQDPLANL